MPYQRKWLADQSRFKIAMVARQCGKTKYMASLEVVEDVLHHEARGEKSRWIILSREERQALEAMEEGIKPWCDFYGAAVEALEYDFRCGPGATYKAHEVLFRNGSRITALPSNPDTARGFTANVVLDEFAIHKESRKIWAAIDPERFAAGLEATRALDAQRQGQQVLRGNDRNRTRCGRATQ